MFLVYVARVAGWLPPMPPLPPSKVEVFAALIRQHLPNVPVHIRYRDQTVVVLLREKVYVLPFEAIEDYPEICLKEVKKLFLPN